MYSRILALMLVLAFPSFAIAQSPFEGIWGNEEYNCYGPCEPYEIRNGSARLTLRGLRIEVKGSRICGVWYGNSNRHYRGFVVGVVRNGQALVAYGREIDHDAASYEGHFGKPKDFEHLPAFHAEEEAYLRVARGRLHIEKPPVAGHPMSDTMRKLSKASLSYWGLHAPWDDWENGFFGVCFAGSNAAIERTSEDLLLRLSNVAHFER